MSDPIGQAAEALSQQQGEAGTTGTGELPGGSSMSATSGLSDSSPTNDTSSSSAGMDGSASVSDDAPNVASIPPDGAATDASTLEGDALPNAGASPAASLFENAASSSAQNALPAVDTEANASNAGANEHPHTSLLRGLVSTMRRKWNVFDAEIEALLKDAENHL